jgi:flagellar operon protein
MKVAELQIHRNLPLQPQRVRKAENKPHSATGPRQSAGKSSFQKVLDQRIQAHQDLKFSAHAVQRLDERQVTLSPAKLERLRMGLQRIAEKGGRSSLILMDDTAYIVSVKNKTVVTTLKTDVAVNRVFTNIDSVAIV